MWLKARHYGKYRPAYTVLNEIIFDKPKCVKKSQSLWIGIILRNLISLFVKRNLTLFVKKR
jgi:hypothetical protein